MISFLYEHVEQFNSYLMYFKKLFENVIFKLIFFVIIMKNIKKALKLKSYADLQSFVFEKYHNLIDVFERQNADKLSSY